MSLANVKGVGKSTQAVLADHGILSVEELAAADIDRLTKIPGFSRAKALRIIRAAKALVGNLAKARISGDTPGEGDSQAPAGDAPLPLTSHELYINRELSQLEFNRRVLAQAEDLGTPLLERLNFLCISCSNMDEFFEVRVASVLQKADLGAALTGQDRMSPHELLTVIAGRAHDLVDEQYRMLNQVLLPALEQEGIHFIRRSEWDEAQLAWLKRYFDEELLPILSPIGLDSAHPFPRILNKSLNFIISLGGRDAFGRNINTAILQAPRALPRIVPLPPEVAGKGHDFVFLSSIIHAFADELFQGMKVKGCWQFRVTRNSELYLDEEAADDLLMAVEGELASRNYGDEVRLEVAENCPDDMVDYLQEQFNLTRDRLYRVDGPVNLSRLRAIYDLVDRPDLKYPPFVPGCPSQLLCSGDIFQALRRRDVLLHHPYESFSPVVEMIRQAAVDPDVIAIKQTLYRTGANSAVVDALVSAARNGKEVTAVIELLARFDEQANISLANRLQEAGAQVVYGIVGYKTHAKMLLILRREHNKLRHYVHLGTGNYHPSTAKLYTDYGLFSCDDELGEDVRKVFVQLTSLGRMSKLHKLYQSPFTLHKALLDKIAREAEHAKAGQPARIVIKVNSVVEPRLIQALYRASMAGVEVKLIVRGVCCLRPGVAGVSERIEVRSIVGRFLEHSRVFSFANGGEPELYLASADLMDRNMFRRVEVAFPVQAKKLQERIRNNLDYYLKDDSQAWLLQTDGSYRRLAPAEGEGFQAQTALLEELKK